MGIPAVENALTNLVRDLGDRNPAARLELSAKGDEYILKLSSEGLSTMSEDRKSSLFADIQAVLTAVTEAGIPIKFDFTPV